MKKFLLFCFIASILVSAKLTAEDTPTFGIEFHGFVKTDVMIDTRQTVTAREGHFLLWSKDEVLDHNDEDINAGMNLNMLSLQSRLTGKITGPDFLGAKSSGVMEGAFFGQANGDENGFRLRHAFVKLDWGGSQLMVGQYWNPLFVTDVFAGVVSFNTGTPFQAFARNPQIRFTQNLSDAFSFDLTAASERDFASTGPDGGSSIYLRNAFIPALNFGLKYKTNEFIIGGNLNYKALKPKLSTTGTDGTFKTDEKITGMSYQGYVRVNQGDFYIKGEVLMGENQYDALQMGGYGVATIDPLTGKETYTPWQVMSLFTDMQYGKEFAIGLFAGYTKNNGTKDALDPAGDIYFRGADKATGHHIDNVFRVSPRLVFQQGKTRFAAEFEYTAAAYGTPDATDKYKVIDTKTVSNLRILLAAYLFF
jgi:hypothetical protein